jgi:hypothetical protein
MITQTFGHLMIVLGLTGSGLANGCIGVPPVMRRPNLHPLRPAKKNEWL